MTTIAVVFTDEHETLGQRIRDDVQAAGYTIVEQVQSGRDSVLVAVLSPQTLAAIQPSIITALDNYQHIIPVLAENMPLPKMIDNLQPLDFSDSYSRDALIAEIERLTAPDAPPPMTALTPSRQRANRRLGLILLIPVVLVFLAAIYGIVNDITVAPEDEFASVDTQVYLTQRYFIDEALPIGTEQAQNFPATVEEIPTRARMEAIMTATAISAGVESTFIPRSTDDALAFPETLEHVSTIVHDRLMTTVTNVAETSAAITPTPTAEGTAEITPEP